MFAHPKNPTWCKICGITSVEDGQTCLELGADAIGLNCFPGSPRFLALSELVEISERVDLPKVALFVNAPKSAVREVVSQGRIDLLQFHGDESRAYCEDFDMPYMKVLRVRPEMDVEAEIAAYASASAILLDAYVQGVPGGTGQQFDWSNWPQQSDQRLIVAGGLTPNNVASAITQLAPFGVDVSSGVEGAVKGAKDPKKIRQFIEEIQHVGGD